MKTVYRTSVLIITLLMGFNVFAVKAIPNGVLGIHIAISAKAYWDGASQSCLPRDKGGCCHIWVDGMEPGPGEITGEMVVMRGRILQLTVSRGKGMNNETYRKYFSDGRFILDGIVTFEPKVLDKLGIDPGYAIPAGTYSVTINGDQLTIVFR